jgi:hypothetical protein
MLTIKNIDRIRNMKCYGREIYHIRNHKNAVGQESYVFEFDLIDGSGVGEWGTPKEVHLVRNEYNGTYGLFTMGLQMATERRIEISKIKDLPDLLVEISLVLKKTKDWWEHSKTK